MNFIKDLPAGPLDKYRKLATFDWKQMKLFVEGHNMYLKQKIWELLETDPIFQKASDVIPSEESKKISAIRLLRFADYNLITPSMTKLPYVQLGRYLMGISEALDAAFPDLAVKYSIGVSTFINILITMGTERHRHFLEATLKGQVVSSLAVTEIAHGSNVKNIRTTATFNKETKEFIINTPDFEAAKCWVGNLGKTCTMTALFAQLYIDEQSYGVHVFIVPIRNPKTLIPYPGIIVGDMGDKIGLQGVDNGFVLFKNFKIPRENLLNKFVDVSVDGKYTYAAVEPQTVLAVLLGNLSAGRMIVMQSAMVNFVKAITIAIRYAALRKQFSLKSNEDEVPILEYQLHQFRLFPLVAAAVVLKVFLVTFADTYLSEVEKNLTLATYNDKGTMTEVHAVISSVKPLLSRTSLDAIQECREACGGHGFLRASGFEEIRGYSDACVTFEGDNNVLGQQSSRWLLRQWKKVTENKGVPQSPLETCIFLIYHEDIFETRNENLIMEDLFSKDFIDTSYKWLIIYLLRKTHQKENALIEASSSKTEAQNMSQVFGAATLTRVYGEYIVLSYFWKNVSLAEYSLQNVLKQLGLLYGLSCLLKHIIYFYQGGYITSRNVTVLFEDAILILCKELKNNIVSIADAMAPPDFVLNSVLGKANGMLYQNLEEAILKKSGLDHSRPHWWEDVIIPNAPNFLKLRSSL